MLFDQNIQSLDILKSVQVVFHDKSGLQLKPHIFAPVILTSTNHIKAFQYYELYLN